MLMHLRSADLLSSDLVLRTAERSLRLPNAMMTARDFLPPGRPCLSAPTATAWLDSWPSLLFTLSSSSSSVSSPSSFSPVHLRVKGWPFSRATEGGTAALLCCLCSSRRDSSSLQLSSNLSTCCSKFRCVSDNARASSALTLARLSSTSVKLACRASAFSAACCS